jgi:hypothetical protein
LSNVPFYFSLAYILLRLAFFLKAMGFCCNAYDYIVINQVAENSDGTEEFGAIDREIRKNHHE